jgi:hypothetical protein
MKFAEKNKLVYEDTEKFLLEVDRLKSNSNLSDIDILITAGRSFSKSDSIRY